jgi:HAD superfamily phosphoserine phosphatase-like hydrolase
MRLAEAIKNYRIDLKVIEINPIVSNLDWNQRAGGLVVLDADGTIIGIERGNHWKRLINRLPIQTQNAIADRVISLDNSSDDFLQQYMAGASLYEFALNNLDHKDYEEVANEIQLREGVSELISHLQDLGFKVVVISYGIKSLLEMILEKNGNKNVQVFANPDYPKEKLIDGFIPEYANIPKINSQPLQFREFLSKMIVIPNTKGMILKSIIDKFGYQDKKIITVGDSIGDIDMLKLTKTIGISILHIHKQIVNTYTHHDILNFQENIQYASINTKDESFDPTKSLIMKLV